MARNDVELPFEPVHEPLGGVFFPQRRDLAVIGQVLHPGFKVVSRQREAKTVEA